jgi:hypothetical protein
MIKHLINLANDLDQRGLTKEAGKVDSLLDMLSKMLEGSELSKALEGSDDTEESSEDKPEGEQIDFHGETTENFDMCPGAVKAFNSLEDKIDDDSRDIALEALRETDELLGVERGVLDAKTATEGELKRTIELAQAASYKAGVLSQKLDTDLSDDFAFLSMHVEIVANHAKHEEDE